MEAGAMMGMGEGMAVHVNEIFNKHKTHCKMHTSRWPYGAHTRWGVGGVWENEG
jgi:hypothetical protein